MNVKSLNRQKKINQRRERETIDNKNNGRRRNTAGKRRAEKETLNSTDREEGEK
jgi:hypothetical protein